jgi:exoribonuclease R
VAKLRVTLPKATRATVDWAALRTELRINEVFSPQAVTEAEEAAQRTPAGDVVDLPFFTLDPVGSIDLDQAMYLERIKSGYRIYYAIADVAAVVAPGSALDEEAHKRVETYYCPDIRVSLYPTVLSEGAASLLPNEPRQALIWQIELDFVGELVSQTVARGVITSQNKRDYPTVQKEIDAGIADPQIELLREIGKLRVALARGRGAIDLQTPEQMVADDPSGHPTLAYRVNLECESWNEQISLLTGIAAAKIMLEGRIGILRTLPPPDEHALRLLRQSAIALRIDWLNSVSYAEFVSSLNPNVPTQAAMLNLSAHLLRGAGYVWFDGDLPKHSSHNAVAAPYAHCTAPLRRLVDRYAGEICVALCAGTDVPQWVRDAMPKLPAEMAEGDRRAHRLDSATIDLAEAVVMQPLTEQIFDGVVVDIDDKGTVVQLAEPPVRARCTCASAQLGASVRVKVEVADPKTRTVRFLAV